jgi:tetratricopeptide (TPR) repeat protein
VAAEEFKQAIELDPRFGRAHGMLATVYVVQNNFGMGIQGELFPLIREHAELAVRYAPVEPESHMAMASVYWTLEWDWPAALKELETTLELDPSFPDGRWAIAEWFGVIAGDTDKGLEIIDEAVRLDPFSATARNLRGFILYVGRRYGEAVEEYRRIVAMDPDEPQNTVSLSSNLALSGEVPEARRLLDEVLPRIPRPLAPEMAVTLARLGDMEEARRVQEDAEDRRAQGAGVPASGLAMAAVAVGDKDSALTWLEVCFAEEGGIYYLRDPLWDPLRSDPRFQDIWDKVGLPGDPPTSGG